MVVEVIKIDSNATGLRIAEEENLGVLPATPVWFDLEPNSYGDFGGVVKKEARAPISTSAQNKKGSAVGLDVAGNFNHDLTPFNFAPVLPGLFRTNRVVKSTNIKGSATAADDLIDVEAAGYGMGVGGGAKYKAGDLVLGLGFPDDGNNGIGVVTGILVDVVQVAGLTIDAAPPAGASLKVVGFQFAAGDAEISQPGPGSLPQLTSTVKDMTEFNLVPGERMFIGGDDVGAAGDAFNLAHNNERARVKTIAANVMTFDKTSGGADGVTEMVTEAGGTKLIRLFFGDVLKNYDTDHAQYNVRTYHLERSLGIPNPISAPSVVQSEVLKGSFLNEVAFNIPEEALTKFDATFLCTDDEKRDGVTAGQLRLSTTTGSIAVLEEGDAFNTSSNLPDIKLAIVRPGNNAAPDPLFANILSMTLTINNGAEANKALGVFGSIAITPANFVFGGSLNVYLTTVAAVSAVRNNSDVTLDFLLSQATGSGSTARNVGIDVDVPLISLGDGRSNVEIGKAIMLPLETDAAEFPEFGHTALITEYGFLPDAALS